MKNLLEDLQKKELEILQTFIEVCEKLNLKYYLLDGSLLGAVRHKGFIPWDDDIDVGMLREDYERFLVEAPALLPSHLFVQTYETDEGYPKTFGKLRDSNTTFIGSSLSSQKINHGAYIDIFSLDRCELEFRNSFKFKLVQIMCNLRTSYTCDKKFLSLPVRLVRFISKLFYPKISNAVAGKERLYKSTPNGKLIANYHSMWGEREIVPCEWYGDGVLLDFAGIKVNCPTEYDK